MKRLLLLTMWGLPGFVLAQTTAPHGVGLGQYKLKANMSAGKKQIHEAAIRQEARQQLAPGTYESRPNSLQVAVPGSSSSSMPRATTPNQEAPGGVAPLPKQELRKKRP
ncbi:hypothetical protein [Hymenobacter fodinae]|uniref:DUF4148 domain-containing protein n=1 Tax=Hymenobacter fodinae TaxID=2510796 RepID=A0A4Z0NZX0_9BACT|nr:hypothetical protein [Hymenobacter fodinae]TGE04119.1 hypothetical protein EU556_22885 [Hymenobacter fodinae]